MWLETSNELKTKQDYINQLDEILAYRSMDGMNFNFGTGEIINDSSYGSEDAYYEMDIDALESHIEYWNCNKIKTKKKKKPRLHKYHKHRIEKRRLKKLNRVSWWHTEDFETYIKRCYFGKSTTYLKKISNRKVRRSYYDLPLKGNKYRRLFDYWWQLF